MLGNLRQWDLHSHARPGLGHPLWHPSGDDGTASDRHRRVHADASGEPGDAGPRRLVPSAAAVGFWESPICRVSPARLITCDDFAWAKRLPPVIAARRTCGLIGSATEPRAPSHQGSSAENPGDKCDEAKVLDATGRLCAIVQRQADRWSPYRVFHA